MILKSILHKTCVKGRMITGKQLSNFYFCAIQVCYTQVSESVQATYSNTLSSTRTRHFHTLLCVPNPHKRLIVIYD